MKLGLGIRLGNRNQSSTPGLLDSFSGAIAAYSLRHLTNTYTGDVIVVRRSSDNATEGFKPDEITDGSLDSFVGANTDWYITTVYDQIGGNHFTQGTTTRQPKIGVSSSLITLNGKPAIRSNGTSDIMQTAVGTIGSVSALSVFLVGGFVSTGLSNAVVIGANDGGNGGGNNYLLFRQLSGSNQLVVSAPANSRNVVNGLSSGSQRIYWMNYSGSTRIRLGLDGVDQNNVTSIPASVNLSQELSLFASASGATFSLFSPFNFQEMIIWDSDQSTDRAQIESEINSYYSTY